MDARSHAILVEQPNPSFAGINDQDRLNISIFPDAVGRYND
jgi:hypothetical protein